MNPTMDAHKYHEIQQTLLSVSVHMHKRLPAPVLRVRRTWGKKIQGSNHPGESSKAIREFHSKCPYYYVFSVSTEPHIHDYILTNIWQDKTNAVNNSMLPMLSI